MTDEKIPVAIGDRWSVRRARAWRESTGWICGFNYLPSSAVNFIEMWHPATFDAAAIDRELRWAAAIGFNALRTNLQYLLWEDGAASYRSRIDTFLDIAARHGLRTVFCLFDDCGFSGAPPHVGIQPDPVPGVHNSRAVASPGRELVMDMRARPRLEAYVRDIVGHYACDDRVLFWDLYNEPGNLMIFGPGGEDAFDDALEPCSLDLLYSVFDWARGCVPDQPLTSGAWHLPANRSGHDDEFYAHRIDRAAIGLSDIVSFHAYCGTETMAEIIDSLEAQGRPLMCTEWMARNIGSCIAEQLPLFRCRGVGAFQWGLARGRSQTYIPWPDVIKRLEDYHPDATEWFHDLIDENGSPYDETETALIRKLSPRPDAG